MRKLYKKLSLIAAWLLIGSSLAFSQNRSITGTVTDENAQGIPGVNVIVKGSSEGTVTDNNGKYTITSVNDDAVLVFSFIGYTSQEVAVAGRSVVDVALASDITSLEEVVVVGYGEQKKSLTSGAISSLKGEELQNISVGQTEQALQGRVAGVLVSPNSGSPGAAARITIRGIGSTGNANPLYIVDGVRLAGANALDFLSPNDIASMEVLKDAASAAIYGAEGANGVVIITTKKGKPNTSQINYNGQWGVQSVRPNGLEVMDANQYVDFLGEAGVASAPTTGDIPAGGGTDWLDVAFDNAPQQSHALDFSGGSDKNSYFLGASYFTQEGVAGGSKAAFDRYTIRLNTSFKLKEWLTVGENLTYANMQRAGFTEDDEYNGLLQNAINLDPLTPVTYTGALPQHVQDAITAGHPLVKDENGNYYGISKWVQAEFGNMEARYQNQKAKTKQNRVIGTIFAELKPFKGFTFTTRYGLTAEFNQLHSWTPTFWFSSESQNSISNGRDDWSNNFTGLWENFASYDKVMGDNHFTVLLGQSMQSTTTDGLLGSYSGLFREEDKWSYARYVPDNIDLISSDHTERTLLSYFGRVSYDYQGKYLFNATLRRDGSSMLADGNKWGTFPSVSAGWVISSEDFFTDLPSVFSYAKFRASWGQNGSLSNLIPGQWDSYIQPTVGGSIRYADALGKYMVGAAPNQIRNADLTWETSEQLDFGLDLRFVNDRVNFTVDYFKKTTRDLLAPGNPPDFSGYALPYINAGTVVNKGFEFELGYKNEIGKAFTWEVAANLTTINNEVTELSSEAGTPKGADISGNWRDATAFKVGQPVWSFQGYKTDGIFQNQAEVDAYLAGGLKGYTPVPGDVRIVDVSGDNSISPADFTNIGSPHPDLYYGIRMNGGYKGFDLTVFLQGQAGNDILMGYVRTDRATSNKPAFFYEDRWTGDGSTNSWFRPSTTGNVYTSDKMIFNGSFARVRQLQLGYKLPADVLSRIGVKNVRFYVSLDNFFTFTKYKGMDPEAGTPRVNSLGIDRGVYPIPRKVLGGLTFSF